jgi:hypothetical protein
MKTSIHIKINDMDINLNDNLDEFETDDNITTDLDSGDENNDAVEILSTPKLACFIESVNNNFFAMNKEKSENKLASVNNNIEGYITSCSNDSEITLEKFHNIIETIENALQEQAKKECDAKENKHHSIKQFMLRSSENHKNLHHSSNQNEKMIEALSPNVYLHKNALVENISTKYQTTSISKTSRKDIPTKSKVMLKLTPPEPPPRKYFTKPGPLNFKIIQQQKSIIKSSQNNYQHHVV